MGGKLQGNGRWESSRLILPEHRSAIEGRKKTNSERTVKRAQSPSSEELRLVKDHILLPMLLTIIEKNREQVQHESFALKKLFVMSADVLLQLVHADLSKVNKKLRQSQIKVFPDEQIDSAIHYKFLCRGYQHDFAMMRDVVRAEISMKLARYVEGIFTANPISK